MGKIHVLTSEISNKIAAGEVVERPASVIKELVENSIDAGATNITVEIKKGGSLYMRVSDNGSGMSEEDAQICFLRHATSKIQSSNDLDAIYTLGFRGEALSSIGAVAKVSLYTKRSDDSKGICVTCEGGEIKSSDDAGIPDGTTIIVENLFYNTPARLKFLKKDATEAGYITDIMSRFILAHPEISFKLITDGKDKLFSPGDSSLSNAVYTVYGRDYAKAVLDVDYSYENIRITGVIGKGNVSRPNRNYQSFFVNKRYIKSPLVIRAVEEAYKNQIMIGKFPMAILNIEINPEAIDINVHPTKLEVKFSDEKDIYHAVYYGVKNALYALPNVPKIERSESAFKRDNSKQLTLSDMTQELKKSPQLKSESKAQDNAVLKNLAKERNAVEPISAITKRPPTPEYNPRENQFLKQAAKLKKDYESEKIDALKEKYSNVLETPQTHVYVADSSPKLNDKKPVIDLDINAKTVSRGESDAAEVIEKTQPEPENSIESENIFIDEYFEVVGQIFDSYIIVEKNDEMLLIDQHAAHERLKYEELKQSAAEREIYSQILLEPEVVNLTGEEFGAYKDNKEIFDSLGFETEEFGDNALLVRSVPGDVEIGDVESLVIELVSQVGNSKKELITEKSQRLMYTIACKSAVKANMAMSRREMETLVRNVFKLKNINTCPHGRPIVITMSKKEIEKEFKRIT
ncbi:MAG: DNA mismatch repair endonuclease MutL [Clostridia bacterium]|nr:DNA mismatch repair endonuclease MutL [Clostridia bacterium]